MEQKCICKTCKYHQHEDIDNGFVCCNPESDYIGEFTDKEDWCSEWEQKEK